VRAPFSLYQKRGGKEGEQKEKQKKEYRKRWADEPDPAYSASQNESFTLRERETGGKVKKEGQRKRRIAIIKAL